MVFKNMIFETCMMITSVKLYMFMLVFVATSLALIQVTEEF